MAQDKKTGKDGAELRITPPAAFKAAVANMARDGGTPEDLQHFEQGIIDILKIVRDQRPDMKAKVNRGLWIMEADGEIGGWEPRVYRALIEEVGVDVKALGIANVKHVRDVDTPQELGQVFSAIMKQKGQAK